MAEDQWYYYKEDERHGPVSFERLQELAESGGLDADDLVSRPGMAEWVPAREVEDLFPAGAPLPPPPPGPAKGPGFGERIRRLGSSEDLVETMPHLRMVRSLLVRLRDWISADLLDTVDRWAKAVGSIALLVAALFLLLGFLIVGIRGENTGLIVGGLLGVPIVTILAHFIGAMFLDAGRSLLRESPSALSSPSFLTCFGLAAFVGSVLTVLGGIVGAIAGDPTALLAGLALAVVLLYAGGVALSPESIHVDVEGEASAGEEAIGVLMFLFKLPLRLVPLAFGAGLVVGFFASAILLWKSMTAEPCLAQMTAIPTATGVFGVAVLPFLAWVVFLLLYLQVDILRAILVIPGKLDRLRRSS
ncbi:MAG: DUF4339 domain-containing protein [Thermoanaerobaculia bacterium]|nr:DUF4339 domain-containing protein [Thermoanaerobaculia bacterium]